jgi:dynein heavy chain
MHAHAQGLREWQAYRECKKTIEDYLEQLPLFQMLAHKAMRPRHWEDIAKVTGEPVPLLSGMLILNIVM